MLNSIMAPQGYPCPNSQKTQICYAFWVHLNKRKIQESHSYVAKGLCRYHWVKDCDIGRLFRITWVTQHHYKFLTRGRQGSEKRQDAALWAFSMKKGAMGKGYRQPTKSGTSKETRRNQPCQIFDFSPVHLISDQWPPELYENNFYVLSHYVLGNLS